MRKFGCTLGIAVLLVLLVDHSAFGQSTISYAPTAEVIPNPERGFFHAGETHSWGYTPLGLTTLQGYRQEGITLIKRYFYLDEFVPNYYNLPAWPWPGGYDFQSENPDYPIYNPLYDGSPVPISAAYLNNIVADFDVLRTAGMKVVVRFAYTNKRMQPPFEDADLDQLLDHLEQLRPILQAHSDVIALVEAGFIGNWGEWFYTDHYTADPKNNLDDITAADFAKRGEVLDSLLVVLPSHMVQLRTPHYKYQIFDYDSQKPRSLPAPLDASSAHDGGGIARTGHHNDCFLGNDTDAGTFGVWLGIGDDKNYLAAETNYVAMGGEVCNPGGVATRFDCGSTLAELEQFHWSYLNVRTGALGDEVYNGWDTGGCLPEIKQRLGYRFALEQGTYSNAAEVGGFFKINIQLRNDGWAAPFNPRPVDLVLRHAGTGDIYAVPLSDEDPRFWLAGDTQTLFRTVRVLMVAGDYELLLHLPDPHPALADRPEYAIQFANNGVWEANTGYNNLGHILHVDPVSTSPGDLLIFQAYPRSINGTGSVDGASAELGQYDYLVLGGGHEKTDHWDYANTVAILAHPDLINTTVFGAVSIGVSVVNESMAEIQTRIDEWQAAGAGGIFFNHFGYNWDTDRARQNAAIDYAHSRGMPVLAEAADPDDAFDPTIDPVRNPTGEPSHLGASDFYLYEAHQVAGGQIYEGFIWDDKAVKIETYRDALGFGVFSYTTNDEATSSYDEDMFFYSWYSALLYGYEATGWGEYAYSGWGVSAEQAPFRQRPAVDPGTVFTGDVQNPSSGLYTRTTDTGTIAVNTTTYVGRISHHPPVAVTDDYSVDEDGYLTVAAPGVLANDSDADQEALTCRLVSDVQHGAVALASDGSFSYAPEPDFSGTDSFTYEAVDETNTSGNTVTVTITVSYVDGVQPENLLAPKTLLYYYGIPSIVNGVVSIEDASAVFGAYDYVVLGGYMQEEDHPDYQNTIDVIGHRNMVGTTVFAYITVGAGVSRTNFSIEEIQTRMDASKAAGVDGIFLDEFDYGGVSIDDPGVTRQRQNAAVDYAHSLGMSVIANGANSVERI